MGFLKKLGKVLLDGLSESSYKHHVIQRPIYYTGVQLSEVKPDLLKRIEAKSLVINAETRDGWKEVALVRAISETEISFSPHRENNFSINSVQITRNHIGKIVARAQGRWIDSGISIGASS